MNNALFPLTISKKCAVLDVWLISEYFFQVNFDVASLLVLFIFHLFYFFYPIVSS